MNPWEESATPAETQGGEPWEQEQPYDPKSPFNRGPTTVQPRPEGITGKQAIQAFIQGSGQGLTFGGMDELVGAVEASGRSLSTLGDDKRQTWTEAYREGRDASRDRLATAKQTAPVITGAADMVGSGASGAWIYNKLAKVGMAPKSILGSAVFGGAEGAANAYGRSDDAEGTMKNLITDIPAGMAFGAGAYGGAELLKRLLRTRDFKPNSRRHEQAEELGIQLTPAQKYMDTGLHQVEASMRSDPGYSRAFRATDVYNQMRANQIAAKTIGLEKNTLTDAEFKQAQELISDKFNAAAKDGEFVNLDGQWMDDLDAVEADYTKAWGKRDAADPVLKDAREMSKQQYISPQEYQFQYSRLGKSLETAKNEGDAHKVGLYRGMRQALNDVLDRTYPDRASQTQEARELYKSKLLLQKPGVTSTETGDVSPLILANKLRKDVPGYLEGGNQSDLYNLGRVSQNFKSGIGDSGTATRSKTALDYLLTPVKETAGNLYMAGKMGTALTGGNAGGGALSNPMLNAILQTPELLKALQDEEDKSE